MARRPLVAEAGSSGLAIPIFILGIAPRSGTNYLHDLIRMHPQCEPQSSVLEEDFLIYNARMLTRYAQTVSRSWKQKWGEQELEDEKHLLCAKIGEGLASFLYAQLARRKAAEETSPSRRLVTKTPHVENLELFFELFPSAPLLILLRDGRSVVESTAKTFDRPYGYGAREWAAAAGRILDFKRRHPQAKYLIVKYEDLYQNVKEELRRIFMFLGLDPESYDYAAAINAPVRGSCAVKTEEPSAHRDFWVAEGVTWNPTPKPTDFNPLARWHSWNRARHERFNWIAGPQMTALGYSTRRYAGYQWWWSAWNVACDVLLADRALWFWRRGVRRMNRIHNASELFGTLREVSRKAWESLLFSRLQDSR